MCVQQGLNNAVALDYHYAEQMIYWTDVTTQGSMIRRMNINGSNIQVCTIVKNEHFLRHLVSFSDWLLCYSVIGCWTGTSQNVSE